MEFLQEDTEGFTSLILMQYPGICTLLKLQRCPSHWTVCPTQTLPSIPFWCRGCDPAHHIFAPKGGTSSFCYFLWPPVPMDLTPRNTASLDSQVIPHISFWTKLAVLLTFHANKTSFISQSPPLAWGTPLQRFELQVCMAPPVSFKILLPFRCSPTLEVGDSSHRCCCLHDILDFSFCPTCYQDNNFIPT